jgi:hypothetical protein
LQYSPFVYQAFNVALAVGKIIEGNVYQRVAGGGDVVFVLGLRQQQGIQGGVVAVEL